jgi:hypothetical protein
MSLDAFVRRDGTYGESDAMTNWGYLSGAEPFPVQTTVGAVFSLPGMLKLDHRDDAQLPGDGPDWLSVYQVYAIAGNSNNPITLVQYDYVFDSTPGIREFSAIPFLRADGTSVSILNTQTETISRLSATMQSGFVTVIPAPGACLLLVAVIGGVTARRRR